MSNESILTVSNLRVRFPGFASEVHALNGCSFDLKQGELLGLVGESGCGKSLTSIACLGYYRKTPWCQVVLHIVAKSYLD